MKISIFGLGYVGTVAAGCLASLGHRVIGVDVNPAKVQLMNEGKSPIVEAKIADILADQHRNGNISATVDVGAAVEHSDISFICVGTPSSAQGHLSLEAVHAVAREIGSALARKSSFH